MEVGIGHDHACRGRLAVVAESRCTGTVPSSIELMGGGKRMLSQNEFLLQFGKSFFGKEFEEKDNGGIFLLYSVSIANYLVLLVLDCSVVPNLARCGITAVPNGAVFFYLSQIGVLPIPYYPTVFNLS